MGFIDKRILVIGGAGFVGCNLVRRLLFESPKAIVVIDNLLSSEKENLLSDERLELIEASITDDKVLQTVEDNYDYIFHLATYHGNQNSIYNPQADFENNTLTTFKLMNHIRNFKNLLKVIYSSAGCSVAEKTFIKARATTEDDPISITQDSPYSISKVIGEFYSVYFHRQYGLPVVRARFQNVYGPREVLGAGKWRGTQATIWRNVVPVFIYKALKSLPLPVENRGIATRDFIYVEDICEGLVACALRGNPGDVYNLASGYETSIIKLAKLINSLTKNRAEIQMLPKRAWDNSGKRFGSTSKSKEVLGFVSKTDLKYGLEKTIQWTRDNLAFIEGCIEKHKDKISSEKF